MHKISISKRCGIAAMLDELQSRIVSLIPSTSLKNQIRLINHRLSDADLLSTAYRYAADYDARVELLQMLEQQFTGDLRDYTSKLIHVQRQMLEVFLKPEDNTVYELHIKDTPDAYDERYLCKSFDAAIRIIPLFFQEYDCEENSLTRYTIVKRRVLSEAADFSDDELGELVMLAGMRVYSVNMWSFDHQAEECAGQCLNCNSPCADCHETIFPQFIQHGDAVKFYDLFGKESYGIALAFNNLPCSEYYVIPLDSDAVRYHDFDNIHDAHQHIPAPLTERIEEAALPEEIRADYKACLKYILEKWPEKG